MQFHWNNARTTWAYDPRGLTALIRHATSVNTLLDFATYTYDAAGNPLTRVTNSTRATWSYDNASRLQTERHSATGLIDTLTYDAGGNRTQRARTQSGVLTIATAIYDAAGQSVTMLAGTARTTFVFDANGNMQSENTAPTGVTTYTWDALNRMVGVIAPAGTRTTYAYRYDDLRASQNPGSGVQTSVWDAPGFTGFGDLFEELDSTGSPLRTYYRAADLAAQKDTTGTYAFHWIDQGTVQLLSDLNQVDAVDYAFTAWGELLSVLNGTSTPLAWNGRWGYYGDTSARTSVRARHLAVSLGRWMSQDRLGFSGGASLYEYCGNSPLAFVDPEGQRPLTPGDMARLRHLANLYDKYVTGSERGGGPQYGFDRALWRAIAAIKAAIAAVPIGPTISGPPIGDPPNLKAVFWAIDRLGNTSYGVKPPFLDPTGYTAPVPKGYDKCNIFVAEAYAVGAGTGWDGSGVPTNATIGGWFFGRRHPTGANELADPSNPVTNFLVVLHGGPMVGDIAAFEPIVPLAQGGIVHSAIYLGGG